MSMEISYAPEGIEPLREEYEHFDEYLIDKDVNDYNELLWAYKYEIKNYSRDVSFNLRLDDELIDKQASKVLFLIRDIVNLSKAEATGIYLGALFSITEVSNWKELRNFFESFKSYVSSLNQFSFSKEPDEEIEVYACDHQVDNTQKDIFTKHLLLKLVRYVCQNRQSPPLYSGLIKGGMLKNEPEFISKSTYFRHKGKIDCSNSILLSLLDVLDDYKDNINGLLNILNTYRINFKSSYIKNLNSSENIAIKIPKYSNVDYDAILAQANQYLASLNRQHSIKKISMEKIVLFLFLVKYFDDPIEFERINVPLNRFSKILGDSKVVSSIRDAFENSGVFDNKRKGIVEVESCSYLVTISFKVDEYFYLNNSLLIRKLNRDININTPYSVEERQVLLNKVIDVINLMNKPKKLNLTQIFFMSGKTTPLLYLLNIISALKSKISFNKRSYVDCNLKEAFTSINRGLVILLYEGAFNIFLGFMGSKQNYIKFYIPTLELVTNNEIEDELRKKFNDSYMKDKSDEYLKEFEDKRIELMEPLNDAFIEKLKKLCGINS